MGTLENRTSMSRRAKLCGVCGLAFLVGMGVSATVSAEMVVIGVDAKLTRVEGKQIVVENGPVDNVTVLDLSVMPPRVVAEIDAATSVSGPPSTIAVSPDESIVLVSSHSRKDPANPKKLTANNLVTVIDLKANPPKVAATVECGKGAAGLSFNAKGDLALVTNRGEGTVSVLSVNGTAVTKVGTVDLGDPKSGPSHVAITPDGKTALVTLDHANGVAVLAIDGTNVSLTKRMLTTAVRPYGLDINPAGTLAAVGNLGRTKGDVDTVSLIDLTVNPLRVVNTVSVGQTPEAVAFSPDGKFLAVGIMNGSQFPPKSPFYNDGGKLMVYAVNGAEITKLDEATIGHWSQGAAWSADGKTILSESMVEKDVMVFAFDGKKLTDTGHRVALKGGGAAIRTAGNP